MDTKLTFPVYKPIKAEITLDEFEIRWLSTILNGYLSTALPGYTLPEFARKLKESLSQGKET